MLEIRYLESRHEEKASKLLSEVYAETEPMTFEQDVEALDFLPLAHLIFKASVKRGLGVGLFNGEEIVGVYLCYQMSDQFVPPLGLSHKFGPILKIMKEATPSESVWSVEDPTKVLKRSSLAIKKEFRGKSHALSMMEACFKRAKELGHEICVGHSNSLQSQTLNMKYFSGVCLKSQRFDEFEFEGERVFKDISDHNGSLFVVHQMERSFEEQH